MTDPVRVVLADDHAALRAGVRAVLEEDGFEVVAEVGDADAAVGACVALGPDLCLLDIDMPGNGIAACRAIRERCLHAVPVMLTESTDDRDLFDALQAGAGGYLLKTTSPARIGEALRGVLAGEAAIPRTMVTKLIAELRDR
jgi:DNA-binding NarL/FixJ family response regulator